jgi:hypothetical protein
MDQMASWTRLSIFQLVRIGVCIDGRRRGLVFELADTGDLGSPRLGDEADFVPVLSLSRRRGY